MNTPAMPPAAALLLSARDAAKALSISSRTLWSLTASGQIPAVRIGRLVRYQPKSLQKYLDAREAQEGQPCEH